MKDVKRKQARQSRRKQNARSKSKQISQSANRSAKSRKEGRREGQRGVAITDKQRNLLRANGATVVCEEQEGKRRRKEGGTGDHAMGFPVQV